MEWALVLHIRNDFANSVVDCGLFCGRLLLRFLVEDFLIHGDWSGILRPVCRLYPALNPSLFEYIVASMYARVRMSHNWLWP